MNSNIIIQESLTNRLYLKKQMPLLSLPEIISREIYAQQSQRPINISFNGKKYWLFTDTPIFSGSHREIKLRQKRWNSLTNQLKELIK